MKEEADKEKNYPKWLKIGLIIVLPLPISALIFLIWGIKELNKTEETNDENGARQEADRNNGQPKQI